MKVIIAGTRTISDQQLLNRVMDQFCVGVPLESITEIVSGGAPGVDRLGEIWARVHNIPIKFFQADWNRFGKSAGPRRNFEMANYANILVLLWDGRSPGSSHMRSVMDKLQKPMYCVRTDELPQQSAS